MKRRSLLKKSSVLAATTLVPARFSIGKPGRSANSRLNIAMIGAGNIARMAYDGCQGENFVALADVDSDMFLQHAERFPEVQRARQFTDYRVMLDKMEKEIDAVCINTPDHTHFVATMEAMQRGLHVCTQKPLTHNVWEARMLKKAKAKYGVVTNMAVQGHTFDGIRQMREWVEADVFGQINTVHTWIGGPDWGPDEKGIAYFQKPRRFPPRADRVPRNLDWDLWLGPHAADTPFNKLYHPLSWRGFHAFGNGLMGDWMPHIADAPISILDLYNPTVVELEAVEGGNEWIAPDACRVRWEFSRRGNKAPCTLYWHNGDSTYRPDTPDDWTWSSKLPERGSIFFGEKQNAYTDGRSNHPRLLNKKAMRSFKEGGYPPEKYPRIKDGPFGEWVRAVKGEGPEPGANFDFASPFTETMLLGALAARFGGRIEWDAENMKVTNRPELDAYIKEPIREGWDYSRYL
jgi:predicted dehydrogenase